VWNSHQPWIQTLHLNCIDKIAKVKFLVEYFDGVPKSVLSLGFKGLAWISSCYRFNNGGGRIHVCMESSMFGALLSLYVFSLCTNQFAHQFVSTTYRSHDVKIDKRVSMVLGTLSLATCLIAHPPSQGMGALRLGWSPLQVALKWKVANIIHGWHLLHITIAQSNVNEGRWCRKKAWKFAKMWKVLV
jgi:hypothetical protein